MGDSNEPAHSDRGAYASTSRSEPLSNSNIPTGSLNQEIDVKFDAFRAKFDELNRRLVGAIAAEVGAPVPKGVRSTKTEDSDSVSEESESEQWWRAYTSEEREAVFGTDTSCFSTDKFQDSDIRPSLSGLCRKILSGEIKKIVVMCGAGISVSAGIPDFRSKGGLYDTLRRQYGMSRPELLFDISYFRDNPIPFNQRAIEMLPGKFRPTPTHCFLSLLRKKGLIQRLYTQNIDTLEKLSGFPDEDVVYAHGSFSDCHCTVCGRRMSLQKWREQLEGGVSSEAVPRCESTSCGGLVKPDIVFFGEELPERFSKLLKSDFAQADCLFVLGTSLQVGPFNQLVGQRLKGGGLAARVLVNREPVGLANSGGLRRYGKPDWKIDQLLKRLNKNSTTMLAKSEDSEIKFSNNNSGSDSLSLMNMATISDDVAPTAIDFGFQFEHEKNFRDLFLKGDCDSAIRELCNALGWDKELDKIIVETSQALGTNDGWKLLVEGQPKD